MADNSSSTGTRDYSVIKYKPMQVVMASFAAMQIAGVLNTDRVRIAYFLAGYMILVAVVLMLIANSLPAELNALAKLLDQVVIFIAVTSMFFSFSIFLPPFISIVVLYWLAYLVMIVTIVSCFYRGTNHPPQASTSGIINT